MVNVNEEGKILYKFYEKPVARKSVVRAESAITERTKRAILTQEGIRRLLNTSEEYPKEVTDEILSEYMQKLFNSGYDQKFRTEILASVRNGYQKIQDLVKSGVRPRHRDRDFEKEERIKKKERNKYNWFKAKEKFSSVMFIPITPGSVLRKRAQERLKGSSLTIKFVEYSGSKIIELLRQGGQDRCDQECLVCGGEKGGRCRSRGCVYQMWCRTCAANGVKSIYTGESGNCAHERANDHVKAFQSTNPDVRSKSVMWRHINEVHDGDKEGIEFDMTVTDIFKDDPLGRQCMEGVRIRETACDYVLNSKEEFRQPGELVAELPARKQRQQQRQQQQQQQQQQQVQSGREREGEGTSGGGGDSSGGGGPAANTRSRQRAVSRVVEETGGVSTRSRTRRENRVVQ